MVTTCFSPKNGYQMTFFPISIKHNQALALQFCARLPCAAPVRKLPTA